MRTLCLFALLAVAHGADVFDLCLNDDCDMKAVFEKAGHWDAQTDKPKQAIIVQYLHGCVFCEITMGSFMYLSNHSDIDTFKPTGIAVFTLPWDTEGPAGFRCKSSPNCMKQAKALGLKDATGFPTLSFYNNAAKGPTDVSDTGCAVWLRGIGDAKCDREHVPLCSTSAEHAAAEYLCHLADGTELPIGTRGDTCDKEGGGPYCLKSKTAEGNQLISAAQNSTILI